MPDRAGARHHGAVTTARRVRGGRSRRAAGAGPTPGEYPLSAGTAELSKDLDVPDGWMLSIDGVASSYVDLGDPTRLEFEYVQWIGALLDCLGEPGAPLDVAHLGGGAFTLPRYVAATRPGSTQVAFEYDERLVELARDVLGLRTSPRLRVRVVDARAGLRKLGTDSLDVVIRDAFVGTDVPAHLTTEEFARDVDRVLRRGGVYVLNLADRPPLARLRAEAATLLAVFRHVLLVTEPAILRGRRYGNLVLAASARPMPALELARQVARGVAPARVTGTARMVELARGAVPLRDPEPGEAATVTPFGHVASPLEMPTTEDHPTVGGPGVTADRRRHTVGLGDKIENKLDEAKGNAKEGIGDATDNESLQAEGQGDQAEAKTKQAGEHVKDAAREVKDSFTK
ncbi:MAG: spermidine synthase-like protein [Mycobacterium sp.]|nr:spermidine synthase-like protein [Mycobacterium sp.]